MKLGLLLLWLCLAGRLAVAGPLLAQSPSQSPPSVRTNLPQSALALQAEAPRNFQVKQGFRLELVASEPLVANPIAMAFDENSRLFVLEAGNGALSPGRVRLLEHSDANGVFDTSSIYAENIANPTALACYNGGVFVASGGRILYLKDTKGDGVADARSEVFNSFGDPTNGGSGQISITGMVWGGDNRIHVVTTSRGGDVISSSSPAQSVVLGEGSFSFDPRTLLLVAESGSGASGICFDDRGHRFISTPTEQVEATLYDLRYTTQNPLYHLPTGTWSVPGQPATKFIYPFTRSGAAEPVRFSAGTGITIYRGNAFPREYAGDVFVADTTANVVHHDKLRFTGIEPRLERPFDEPMMEFLAGRNNSFQPTQIINAPDGALYVAGLTRETAVVSKEKTNAPSTTPAALGRIYRIVPVNFKQPKLPKMGKLSGEQLVAMLRHPNGWHRDTASRLLYERQDRTALVPLIRLLFDPQSPPLARLHALRALDGIELVVAGHQTRALLEQHLLKALMDPDERVREQAVLLSEQFVFKDGLWPDAIWGQLSRMGNDPSPQVRWQLAFTLGQGRNPGRAQTLAEMVRADVSSYRAVLSSLNEGAAETFGLVVADSQLQNTAAGQDFLHQLILMIGRKSDAGEVRRAVIALQNAGLASFGLALDLESAVASENNSLAVLAGMEVLNPLYARASSVAVDSTINALVRAKAWGLLATRNAPESVVASELAVGFVRHWPYQETRANKQTLLKMLLSRPEWTPALMTALQNGWIQRAELNTEQIRFLLAHPDANIRARAASLFINWNALQRQPVVNRYYGALRLAANAERGRALFAQNCQICHTASTDHAEVALKINPAEFASMGKERLLMAILNPSRSEASAYPFTLLATKNGELLSGFIVSENANCTTFCDWQGWTRIVAHSNIATQTPLAISGMPEDWEATLSVQNMADLLEYLAPVKP